MWREWSCFLRRTTARPSQTKASSLMVVGSEFEQNNLQMLVKQMYRTQKMLSNKTTIAFITAALLAGVVGGSSTPVAARTPSTSTPSVSDWPTYGGQPANDHYSALSQINTSNVSKLKVAWTYDTGEDGGMETNPLVIGKVLYS